MADSKMRAIRVPDDGRWEAAAARAKREGTNVSAVINEALAVYAGQVHTAASA